jgi:NADPH:quinone reductase-like Zn-dependent oxidoreductase
MMVRPNQDDLGIMKELVEAGKVTPMVDRRNPVSEIADAFHNIREGHARGKVVINVAQNSVTQPVR